MEAADENHGPPRDEPPEQRPKLKLGGVRPSFSLRPAQETGETVRQERGTEELRPLRDVQPERIRGRFQRMAPWLLFLLVGVAAGLLRYGQYYPPAAQFMQTYGPYAVGALHVVLIVLAFQDTVFSGILCLVIPGYSLYYLFAVTDRHLLRAAAGGLLIGTAEDSLAFYQELALSIHHVVSSWIAGH